MVDLGRSELCYFKAQGWAWIICLPSSWCWHWGSATLDCFLCARLKQVMTTGGLYLPADPKGPAHQVGLAYCD